MRRTAGLAIAVVLILSSCSGDTTQDSAATSTTTTTGRSTTTSSTIGPGEVATSAECPGIGPAPAAVEVTWIAGGRLWSASPSGDGKRCLLEANVSGVGWSGTGDRAVLDDTVVVGDELRDLAIDRRELLGFSLPTGKVVLERDVDDGMLYKVSLEGAPVVKLDTFANLDREQGLDVAYHPSGTAIVAAMPRGDRPGLLLATNLGEDPRWLVDNETASRIYSVSFTRSGSLVFAAEHEDHTDLHELDLTMNALTTPLESPLDSAIQYAAVSPWRDGDIAVARSADADPGSVGELWVRRDFQTVDLSTTAVADSNPVGWLPDGSLLVQVFEGDSDCCDAPTGDLYVVEGTTPRLLARDVQSAAVRGVLPPAPPPPPRIDQAAPA